MQELLTVKEAAILLGVNEDLVKNWAASNILEYVILPHKGQNKRIRIKKQSVEQFIRRRDLRTC